MSDNQTDTQTGQTFSETRETPQDAKREAIPSASLVASDLAHVVAAAETSAQPGPDTTDPTLKAIQVPVGILEQVHERLSYLEGVQSFASSERDTIMERLTELETKLESVGGTWLSDMKAWFQRHTGT